jgi:phospholipid/cholesterol/gamma-HCH transport system substrate-binding protein
MKLSPQSKVGIFAVIAIAIVVYLTLRVSDLKFSPTGTYFLYLEMPSAANIDKKTPVQVAGIQVGIVDGIQLTPDNRARLKLKIRKGVILPKDVSAQVRTRGVLGDVFLELIPGKSPEVLEKGGTITNVSPTVDINELTRNLNDVAVSLKRYTVSEDSVVAKSLQNIEKLTEQLAKFTTNNRQNMDQVVMNLRDITHDLKGIVRENSSEVNETLERLRNITSKIDEGKGTVGKLINDPSTGEKVNEAIDNVNNVIGPISRLQTEIGYHLEYLGTTHDFKNYVSLTLKPRPDKYFLLEFVSDSDPSPTFSTTTTNVTAGGVTTTVVTDTEKVDRNRLLISAEVAKSFYDFTFRGGLIESTGGLGIDYNRGPFSLQFSAFDFINNENQNPHLKILASANITKGFYLLGGVDDFISKQHDPDWFFGAGIRFLDDDIKSLFSAFSLGK